MKIPFTQLLQAGAHFAPANGVAGQPAEGMPGMPGQPGLALHGGQQQGAFIDQVMGGLQIPGLAEGLGAGPQQALALHGGGQPQCGVQAQGGAMGSAMGGLQMPSFSVSNDDEGGDPGMTSASLSAMTRLPSMPQSQPQQAPAAPQGGQCAATQGAQGGQASGGPAMPSANDKAAPGASAQSIVDGNPTLKNLGNQSGVKDNLKKQCGDWDDPSKSPQERADSAQRASNVVDWVKNAKDRDGDVRDPGLVKNGKIEGFTKDGDARHGTEAGLLQDFGKYGYGHLKADQRLDQTNDGHVKKNGTNMDNAEYIGHKILDGLSKAFNFIGDLIKNTIGKIPGLGKVFSALAELGTKAIGGALHVADTAVIGGDVKKAGVEMGASLTETAVGFADPTGLGAKAAGDAVRGSYKG
jgi:hypothetical protein